MIFGKRKRCIICGKKINVDAGDICDYCAEHRCIKIKDIPISYRCEVCGKSWNGYKNKDMFFNHIDTCEG